MNKKDGPDRVRLLLATGFYTGYSPVLPGTCGTVIGVLLYLLLNTFTPFYYFFIFALFFLGVYLSRWAEAYFHEEDSRKIVIDEITGFLVTMGPIRISFTLFPFFIGDVKTLILGFVLFRFMDIIKPYPIRKLEKLKNGFGVMTDDILAGLYAFVILYGLRYFGKMI